MMGQGRCGHAQPLLDFAHREPGGSGADEGAQDLHSGFGADRGKSPGCLGCMEHNNYITNIIVIILICQRGSIQRWLYFDLVARGIASGNLHPALVHKGRKEVVEALHDQGRAIDLKRPVLVNGGHDILPHVAGHDA